MVIGDMVVEEATAAVVEGMVVAAAEDMAVGVDMIVPAITWSVNIAQLLIASFRANLLCVSLWGDFSDFCAARVRWRRWRRRRRRRRRRRLR